MYSQQHAPQNAPQHAAQNTPQYAPQTKQPLAKGLVQVPVGTYQSKTEFEQDGRTPKQKTEFLPMGRFTDWGNHISAEIVIDGKKLSLMLFKENHNGQGQQR